MSICRHPRALIETFESRILYSADPGPAGLTAAVLGGFEQSLDGIGGAVQQGGSELVFVDARVPDIQQLLDDLAAQQRAGRAVEIFVVGGDEDGIALIGASLAGRHDISAVHVLGHGSAGVAEVGATRLDAESVFLRAGEIAAWGDALSVDADLLLYGCDVAADAGGRSLVSALAQLTGADVAASDDLTGAAALGGDWNLEFTTGRIETAVAPSVLEQQAWSGILAISANGTVTSTSSSNTTTTPLSWSHTVAAGSNRVMFVELAIGSSGTYAQAVSYGGVGMQLVGRTSSSDPVSVEIWRLVNPTVGTANVVASFSATTAAAGGATTYNGVDQTTPVRGGILVSAHGTGTTASVTVASAPGDLVIDVQSWQGLPSGGAVGAGQSLLWSQQNGNTGGSTSEPGAASVEMSGSFGSSANWVIGAVSLKAAAGITVTPISGLTVTEGGGTAQFSVVLDSAPTANVTVGLTSSNPREGTLSASSLTFTTANWNVAQKVTVTGVDDTYIDGNTAFSVLTAAATSTDPIYSGLNPADVSLTNTDNDTVNTLVVDTTSDTADGTTTSIAALMANKGGDGKISLREAITAANNTANGPGGVDRILFSIAGSGPHSISLSSALPTVTQAVIIDGSSEPDFAGTPVIELNGAGVGTFSSGILLGSGSSGSTIKGLVINRFSQSGIRIEGGSGNNLITGNYLGTDTTGLLDLGNTKWGLELEASGGNNVIGGNSAALRNVISGNNLGGVSFNGATVTGNLLQGNYIGVGRDGTTALGNSGSGGVLVLNGASATVGGVGAGLGNLIANNTGHGVDVKLGTATILGNAIVGNSSLGIDLGDNGTVEVNDAGDADSGPNNLQNYPVLTSATYGGGRVLIVGTLNSNASTTFRIEFFSSVSGDASAHGESQVFLGAASVTTDSSGNASFSVRLTGTGMTSSRVVSATATVDLGGGTYGSTSEFSANINSVASGPTVSAPPTQTVAEDGSLVFSSANGNGISVGDGMAGDGRLQVALASPNGTLTLGGTAGLTFMGGANGSANMVLWGTKSALNAALNGLAFTPVGNFNGSASISVTSALAADLAGYYPFSGGSTADQAAGAMQNGTLLGNAAVVTDPTRGEVLSLDGNGDALQIDSLFGQPQNVTIGGWVNLTKQTLGRAEFISLDDRVHLALDDTNGVKGSVQVSAGVWTDLHSTRFLAGTGWHHVMYVFDDANDVHSLYIDGSLVGSAANTNSIDYTGATTTYIGRHPINTPGYDFQGQLDDVRIYDRALTASEVGALAIDFGHATSAIAVMVTAVNDAPTFDAADFVAATSIGAGNDRTYATVVQPDGKIVVAGYTHNGSNLDFVLVRYNADGTLDTGFGGGDGIVTQAIGAGDDEAYAVALQADGKILVAGRTANGGHDDFALVRYLADGSLDTSFGGGDGIVTTDFGSGSSDQARSMVVQSDGRIVLGGKTNLDIAVARYLADGTLDTSFSGDGKHIVDVAGSNDEGLGLALQADGRIIQVGSTFIGGNQDFAVLRYNTDGSLDTSFGGGDGIVTTPIGTSYDIAHSVVVQTDGKIVVGGYYGVESFNNNFAVVRYAADGSLDTTFGGGDGIATTDFGGVDVVWSLALQSDNKIVAAGGSGVTAAVVRYAADGSLDTSFSGDGMLMLPLNSGSYFCAMAVQSDGRIVLTGFTTSGSNDDVLTLGLTADGQLDTRANPGSTSLGGTVSYTENGSAVVLDSNVRIYDTELSAANNFNGATLTLLRSGGASAQDVFSATGNLAALIPGGNLVLSGVTVGTVTTHSAGTLLLTFNSSATQARINEVMNSIAYANSSDTPPASVVINWTFNDGNTGAQGTGGALTATGSTTVSITAVNDAPVVTTTGTALAYTENAAATAVDSGLTVSDVDTATLASATVSITSGFVTGQDTLAFTNQNGITGSWSAGTGVLTLTGSATLANYQTALRSVAYINTSDNPSSTTRTVSFVTSDGSISSAAATRGITITAINDAPVFTGLDGAPTYTSGRDPVVLDADVQVFDAELSATNFDGVTLLLQRSGGANGQDVFSATGTLSFNGGTVSVGATAIGSVTTNSAGTLRLTFNADATNALVNSALQQIAYSNSGSQAGSVQIDWTLSDGNTGAQGAGGALGAGGSVSVSLLSPPGITVSAISGATTEAGGTASFTVVLDALPTGDVSIAVSSSNPQEGTVSTALLSFTAANWNIAQTVTITGIDESLVDGNRAYTVVLGAASSSDAAYNGLKPADVAVTNLDNDTQSTIVVTTASDAADAIDGDTSSLYALLQNKGSDGLISLREAIIAANNSINGSGGADRIHFGVAGTGEHLINLAAALPAITDAVILDASTDDSFAVNGNKPAIVLDGNNLTASGLELAASADGSTIRGLVIRDFDGSGIVVQAGSDGNTLAGNYIGRLNPAGDDAGASEANTQHGVYIAGANNTVGGPDAADGNVISGNLLNGVHLAGAAATGNTIQGNRIGVGLDGTTAIGNTGDGVRIANGAGDTLIGGTTAAAGNLIANQTGNGINIASADSTGNAMLGNRIYASGALGIDLGGDGISANDTRDADTGANNLQNAPVLTSALTRGTDIALAGTLNSLASTLFRIEFFASASPNLSGYGEGQIYLGFVDVLTDASGNASFNPTFSVAVPTGHVVSSTATRLTSGFAALETSEFSVSIFTNVPAITSDGGGSAAVVLVAENTTLATTVTATDPDGTAQNLSFTLSSGPDKALFAIDASTGVLSFLTAPDYEAPLDANGDNIYEVVVQVADGTGAVDRQTIAVTVTPVNETPPTITSSATASVAENTTTVSTVTASDPDRPAATLSYRVAGGADAALFAIDASTGALSFITAPDFDTPLDAGGDNVYDVTVEVTDGDFSSSQAIAVTVTPVNETPPTITSSATAAVAENTTAVLTLTATDPDRPAASLSYRLAGGADAALFAIDASTGALSFITAPDYETPLDAGGDNVYDVTVEVTDGTFSSSQALAITVTPVNETPPTITSSATASVAENTTAVSTVTATDPDRPAASLSYRLAGGADAALFAIDASTGALSFITAPDYETPLDAGGDNIYNVTVEVTDGDFSSSQALAITVTPVNDNTPTITSSATASVAENTTTVSTVTATDPDRPAASLSYRLAGGADAALFAIDANTGALSFITAPDFETPLDANGDKVYDVVVSASDGALAVTQTLAISVENRNEMPQGSDGRVSIVEDGRHVFVLADFGFADPLDAQANGLAAVQIVAVPGQGSFLLAGVPVADGQWILAGDIVAGLLSYAPAANDNGAAYAALNFRVRDDGGTADGGVDSEAGLHTLTIDVSAANDLPVGVDDSYSLDEDTPLIVGGSGVLANDVDPDGDPLATERLAGPAHGTLSLAADGSFRYTPDADWSGTDSFIYRSFGGSGYGAPVTVRLVVRAINDAPIIESAAIEVMPGGSASVGSGSLVVADSDSAAGSIRIQIERVTGGHFELRSTPGVAVGEFGYADLAAGQVVFRQDGSATLPVIVLQANDGQASGPALSVRVSLLPSVGVLGPAEPPVVVTPSPVLPSPSLPVAPASPPAANPPAAARPVTPPASTLLSSEPSRSGDNTGELAPPTLQASASGNEVSRVRSYGVGAGMLRFEGARVVLTLGVGTTGPLMEFMLSGEDLRGGTGPSSGGRIAAAEKAHIPPLTDGAYADAQLVLQAVELSGMALSVGVVWWATRAGGLVASLLMAAPAWRSFDPLPVLGPQDEGESGWGGEVDDEMLRDEMGAADVFDADVGVAR